MPDDPVTLGELGRRFSELRHSIDNLSTRVVTRDVWTIEQQRLAEWIARIEREHAALEERLQLERERETERRNARIEADRAERVATRRLVYGALLAGVVGFLTPVLTKLYGG